MQQPRAKYQRQLFEQTPVVPAVRFPRDVQEPLCRALAQWLQAVAKRMREEAGDEQDQR